MSFLIKGKVALVTGGASGIGLKYAKELLKNGLRAVTLADINKDFGKNALEEIQKEFGSNKANFIETDVTNNKNFEEAFQKTVKEYKNLDILVNNAGILNDKIWEKQIAINVNGTIHGTLLALENYIPKYKTSSEGVIVNISSITGLAPHPILPVYTATKFAVIGMSISFGHEDHYQRTKVKVLTLCPGITDTPLISEVSGRNLGESYQKMLEDHASEIKTQEPKFVAKALIKIIQNAKSGTIWVAEHEKDPYEFILPERESFAPK